MQQSRCEDVLERLEAFSTGELESFRFDPVARYLESCGDCRRAFDRLRGMAALLRGAPVPPAPEGFAARILAGSGPASKPAGRASVPILRRVAAILVAAAGLAAGSVLGWQAAGGTSPPDPAVPPYGELLDPVPESSAVRVYLALLNGAGRRP